MSGAFERFRLGSPGSVPGASPPAAASASRAAKRQRLDEPAVKSEPGQTAPAVHIKQHTPAKSPAGTQPGSATKHSKTQKVPDRLKPGFGVPEALGDHPLRLVIVGSNPSEHAWQTGCFYSNPVNYMWRILKQTGIAPAHIAGAQDDWRMPSIGVGFIDVGHGIPGTHQAKFSPETMQGWAPNFYAIMRRHLARACASARCGCGRCGAPSFMAFAGKTQYLALMNAGTTKVNQHKSVPSGCQQSLPQGWPMPASTEVWVMPSTSGAAAMTKEAREQPWQDLYARMASVAWPRTVTCPDAVKLEPDQVKSEQDGQ